MFLCCFWGLPHESVLVKAMTNHWTPELHAKFSEVPRGHRRLHHFFHGVLVLEDPTGWMLLGLWRTPVCLGNFIEGTLTSLPGNNSQQPPETSVDVPLTQGGAPKSATKRKSSELQAFAGSNEKNSPWFVPDIEGFQIFNQFREWYPAHMATLIWHLVPVWRAPRMVLKMGHLPMSGSRPW